MQCIKFEHTEQLFQSSKINNLYKLDVATFVYKFNEKFALNIFLSGFQKTLILILIDLWNLTMNNQFTILKQVNTQFHLESHISRIASSKGKQITTLHKFKAMSKSRLLFLENKLAFSRGNFFNASSFMTTLIVFSFNTTDILLGLDNKTNIVFCKFLPLLDILFS